MRKCPADNNINKIESIKIAITITAAEVLIQCLENEGVEVIFGVPGGPLTPFYEALSQSKKIRHVLAKHEGGAAYMANGYARASRKLGVCCATSGPGGTNALTGIAASAADSVPVLIITAQVATSNFGAGAAQDGSPLGIDLVQIYKPATKFSTMLSKPSRMQDLAQRAIRIAQTGRPGPVHINLPVDFAKQPSEFIPRSRTEYLTMNQSVDQHAIKNALALLMAAKNPCIIAGSGVLASNAYDSLEKFANRSGIPVATTPKAKGVFPENHLLSLGVLGLSGHAHAESYFNSPLLDALLVIGSSLGETVTYNWRENLSVPIIHIDIDPSSIAKRVKVDVPVVGDLKLVLEQLLGVLRASPQRPDPTDLAAWWKQVDEWRVKGGGLRYKNSTEIIKPQFVIEKLCEITGGDAFVTSDVGQHQMWAAQYYKFNKPRRWINSGGLGTMGFGLPAAMGVQLINPGATVACVTGEGSIQMNIQELSTCKQFHLPIKVISLNNRYLGMVRQWQEFFHGNRYSESYMDALPDFVKLAEAYGHVGMRIEKPSDVEPALKEAFGRKQQLVFMDFITDQTENVFPMVQGGKGLSEVILAEDL